ncbi:MAG: glycosyltransferase [Deltaproteobacteria bacterium]
MNITILAIGSRGDVQPHIALGLGLKSAGYGVTIATHAVYEKFIGGFGLGFFSVKSNPMEILEQENAKAALEGGANRLKLFTMFASAVKPYILGIAADLWNASRGADALVYNQLSFYFGPHIAEKLRIPSIAAFLPPLYPTGAFPSLLVQRNLGASVNRLTWLVGDMVSWLPFRSLVNRWRQEQLGLPLIPFWVNYRKKWRSELKLMLFCISPSMLPKPPDWGERVHLTGFWHLDDSAEFKPSPRLQRFLDAGAPPVYVGFGSLQTRDPQKATRIVLDALSRAGQRGVIATGWGGIAPSDIPESVFQIDAIPHGWLFPQMRAVVHHGGTGTTYAGVRAGVPSVLVPFSYDHPFWARRIADLGVGSEPIPVDKLSVERLASAIFLAVGDSGMRERAADLSRRVRAEDGVARAVQLIDRYLKRA